jgi:hypothetical protein
MKLSDLIEGRDASLYHGTSMISLVYIIKFDVIFAGEYSGSSSLHDTLPTQAISVSRDPRHAQKFTYGEDERGVGGVIVLSQTKLNHDYKIIPFDESNGEERPVGHGESEELVVGKYIKPLSRYMTAFIISDSSIRDALRPEILTGLVSEQDGMTRDEFIAAIQSLADHPLRKH